MAVVMLPLDATAGSPSFTAQQTRQAFSAFLGLAPSGRPLGAISGVRPGTPTTTVFMSGGGSTTWNVAAHSGVLDTQISVSAGPYAYATDGTDTGSITAANATNPRVDIIYVKVNDNAQDGSGLTSGQVLYLAGTAASSPVAPTVPARGMVLANINVPVSGGGAPSVTWMAPTYGANPERFQIVRKSADETVTSSAVLQNDDQLFFSAVAGQTYLIDATLFFSINNSSVDAKVGFAFPAGTLSFGAFAMDPAVSGGQIGSGIWISNANATSGSTALSVGVGATSAPVGAPVLVRGSFLCTTSGIVTLMWAQNTSTAQGLVLQAGSTLQATRVVA